MLRLLHPRRLAPGLSLTRHLPVSTTRLAGLTSSAWLASKRTQYLKAITDEYGAAYKDLRVDTAQLLETLRNMQSYRSLTPNRRQEPEYRAALRAVSQLSGADGGVSKPSLTVAELEGAISAENGVSWRIIHELLHYGFSTELESITDKMRAAIMINRVHGFGKIRALALAEAGASSLEDLLKSVDKEYGRKIAPSQKLAIQYHKEMELMIPRAEVEQFRDLIEKALKEADPDLGFEIMGSFRRGDEVSSDIDMVVWHPSFVRRDKDEKPKRGVSANGLMGKILIALVNAGLLDPEKMFAEGESTLFPLAATKSPELTKDVGEKKCMGLAQLPDHPRAPHRQIDIRLCPTESLPYMLLGNSGDDTLMKLLRWRAIEKGWTLNEYGMGQRSEDVTNSFPVEGTEVIVKDEQEIFAKLGVPYLEPHERKYAHYRTLRFFKDWDL